MQSSVFPVRAAALLCLCLSAGSLQADPTEYVNQASTWKFLQGTQEASTPDTAAWRSRTFVETGWQSGPAPFGYGDGPYGTNLGLLNPPMRDNYSSLFLRKTFPVADPSQVVELEVSTNYDDGFVAWINGTEILRVNVSGSAGDPVVYDGFSAADHEQGPFEVFDLPPPAAYLVAGNNVLAVQVFNTSLSSSDLTFDVELYDPLGPDTTPPAIASLTPAAGTTVPSLTTVEVRFSEDVTGVGAGDLLVRGVPASGLAGSGSGPYVFSFPQPAMGAVAISWGSGHAIADLADPPNAFPGGAWTVTLDPNAPSADLVITEFLAAGATGLEDADGEASDWIEVHNRGSAAVSLSGIGLTDDPDEAGKWTFPAVVLAPGAYRIIFASGKDRRPTSGELHTNFQLNAAGEYLGLHSASAPRVVLSEYAPRFPPQRTDYSYGAAAGVTRGYFDSPTPGAANGGAIPFSGFVADPAFDPPRGLYSAPLSVDLTSTTPGVEIFFTTDGSEPTDTTGTPYTGPIALAGTPSKAAITLRAIAYKDGYLPSHAITHTYIFADHVLTQPANPSGFPATWGNGLTTPADYRMDPLVTGAPAYASLAREGLESIPTLSIVTDLDNLFDPQTGIYMNPSFEGVAWERPVSAEWIFPGGNEPTQIDCGLRIQGGSSTSNWKSLKLSMRLLFKDDYGPEKFQYPLYDDSRVETFNTLVLDAGLNLTWNHPDHGQRVRSQYVRDQYVSDLQEALGQPNPHGVFVNVYLNGLYWGLYNVHERPDASYAEDHLGGSEPEYDVIRHVGNEVVDGNVAAWNAMMAIARSGISSNTKYEQLQAYLDAANFADYMMVNTYVGNDDWPRHNWYAVRRRVPGAGFKFLNWDAEHILKDVNSNQLGVSDGNSPGELFQLLRQNAEFRLLFADRVRRAFFDGGPLFVDPASPAWDPANPERNRPAALYMRRIDETDPAIILESARWGDVRRPGQPYVRNVEWQAELNGLINTYFPQRSGKVLAQFRAAALYPSLDAPVFSQQGGVIQPGFALTMSIRAGTTGTIYYTLDGLDPRVYGAGAVSPTARAYGGPIVLGDRTQVRARIQNGALWSALNDATFTLDVPLAAIRITELMYNPPGGRDLEFIELKNTGLATLELGGAFFSAGISFSFPPNTPMGPGGFLVLVANRAAFSAAYPGVPVAGEYSGSLDNAGERVTLRDLDGVTIVSVNYNDERFWPLSPDGFERSLVIVSATGDPDDPFNWRASKNPGGSPGASDPAAGPGGVIVSEVLARSSQPYEDAIELLNITGMPLNIGGWYLSDSRVDESSLLKFRIPDGTSIPAGGHVVFYENQFNSTPGVFPSFSLDERGGAVYLASARDGALTGHITGAAFLGADDGVSSGAYETSTGLDFTAMILKTFGADAPSTVEEFRGGAGEPNGPPRVGPVVINELRYSPAAGGVEFIELHNLTNSPFSLHSAAAGRGWMVSGIANTEETDDFEFAPGTTIPARGYLVLARIDPATFRALHAVPPASPVLGPFGGALDNGGERIELLKPYSPAGGTPAFVLVDQVRYNNSSPWPTEPDGGDPTLERTRAWEYGNDPVNWDGSLIAGGTPGSRNSVSPPDAGNQLPIAFFTASPAIGDAPLEVAFDASQSFDADGSIASFAWAFGDGRSGSGSAPGHTFEAPGEYSVTLTVTDDGGALATAGRMVTVKAAVTGGMQLPGDANQDLSLDIADVISLLFHLFSGSPIVLPCEGGTVQDPGNRALLNANGDASVNLADAVFLLQHQFLGGPAHVLGTVCTPMEGCPEACGG